MKLLLAALVVCSAAAYADEVVQPATVEQHVDDFHGTLLEALRTPTFDDRFTLLEPTIRGLFDLETIARISLGQTWRTLSDEQRANFVELLRELVTATYADRFDSFNEQRFERGETVATRRGWVVKTELVRSNGERVNLDYYFRGDRVFNVVADGVSDLSLRRADYNSIIKRDGFDALIGQVEANIVELEGRQ